MELPRHLGLAIGVEPPWPATFPPTSPSSCQTRIRALPNEVALELGQSAKDMEDQLPATGGGIDLFGEALKSDAAAIELSHQINE